MRPFLKWPGNKHRVLQYILPHLPSGKRLIEPFAGSAAVTLNSDYPRYLIAEHNNDLVQVYRHLKREKHLFIDFCQQFFSAQNNAPQRYYHYREMFNNSQDLRLRAALFIYLNRHGYNGLCRYNNSGQYNVPFGRYQKPYFPLNEMRHFIQRAPRITIRHADYRSTLQTAKPDDIVYCDPPYLPLSSTANFTHYSHQAFSLQAQHELAQLASLLTSKGITIVISNHDTPHARQLYQQAHIISFPVPRFINCLGHKRQPAQELLAIYNPST
ncbi:MAG: Dam family site-specific DNA-(adenine-N6)-methyltransferase [Gammaproteobacteria bacterium]